MSIIIFLFVETPRKFITAKLSIRKPRSSSVLIICDLFNSHASRILLALQSRSPSLRSSGRNARLWDNPLAEARNPG